MKKIRFGINPLALFAGITLIISMLFPWWTLEVSVMNRPTDIYPYLIDGPASDFIGYKRSPQMTILFYLLIACIFLFILGSFIKGKGFAITLTIGGVLVGLAIWRFLVRIAGVAKLYEVPIQGHGVGNYGGFAMTDVYTLIQPGLYLAAAAAVLGVLSGFFHKKLTDKFSLNWITNDPDLS
ncbi:MAG: hypothetical protein K0B14_07830 [Anaerolineaceae bacterium]|nr:hypothetical protein [Anaerolineaceae bacterium]